MTPYYADDLVTLYLADCREWEPLPAEVMVTDPPYGMAYNSGWSGVSIRNDHDTAARDAILARWSPRPALVFGRWSVPAPFGTRHVLIWDKGDWPGMGDLRLPWGPSTEEIYVIGGGFVGKRRGSILHDPHRPTGESANHPSEKPLALMSRLIESCPSGTVLDPFCGSGSTLVAAKMAGRPSIGIEIEERYCEIAATRCSQEVLGLARSGAL